MARDRTRRHFLQLTGAASVLSLAGCASVTDQLSNDTGSSRATSTGRSRTTPASTPAQTSPEVSDAEETRGDDGSGTDDDSWSPSSVTIDAPEVALASVPLPEERTRYARMGTADATATATLFGNWKCPYTQEFVLNQLPTVVDRFVDPGDLALEFRSVAYLSGEPFLGPDAPRASRAGLAVWDVDPQSYWSYFAHVFANQPQERYEWGQPSLLLRFAEASSVSGSDRLRQSIESGAYAGPVQTTAETAAERGITTVPRIAADGTVTAPTVDFEATLAQLRDVVQS